VSAEDREWLLARVPGVSYLLTGAKTAEGVARAFESLVHSMVDRNLEKSRQRRKVVLVGSRIMEFAARRGRIGVTKKELLASFKQLDVASLMKEVESLQKLGLVTLEETGPGAFRLILTEKGTLEVEKRGPADRVTDDTPE